MHKRKAFDASRYFFITLAAYYISRHNIYHWHGQQTIVWLNLIQQVYSSWYQYKSISNKIEEKTKSFKTFHSVFSSSNTYKNNQKRCRGYSINNNNTLYIFIWKKKDRLIFKFSDSKQWVITKIWPSMIMNSNPYKLTKCLGYANANLIVRITLLADI